MSNPYIQIDELVREMTDEEYQEYLQDMANEPPPLGGVNE